MITILLIGLFSHHSAWAESQDNTAAKSSAWQLPSLILNDLEGQPHDLYEWQGKVIMLNFWATWCRPCLLEIPDFIAYQHQYADKGLQIIGVGLDEVKKLRNFVRTTGINYPILQADRELQYSLLNQWGNPFGVVPYTVVIDRVGKFIFMKQGIIDKKTFDTVIKPLLD